MSYCTQCKEGHQYVAADNYVDWPKDLPKCPVCRDLLKNPITPKSVMKSIVDIWTLADQYENAMLSHFRSVKYVVRLVWPKLSSELDKLAKLEEYPNE